MTGGLPPARGGRGADGIGSAEGVIGGLAAGAGLGAALTAASLTGGAPGARRFTVSTTTALERPCEKLWRTVFCSRGRFSVSVFADETCSVLSPGVFVSLIH
jgi:hypothetical protein